MAFFSSIKEQIETDDTIRRVRKYGRLGLEALPRAVPKYFLAKFPVISWLPRYNLKWIINDVFAGVTMGILLLPQSLAYAKIASISPQFGLITSLSPPLVYFLMGTSKDVSVGPTSIIALLTSQIIKDFQTEELRPEVIAAAVSVMVGFYCWIFGFLQLGWILNFISLPALTGFISAVAWIIISRQIPQIFGISPSFGESHLIHNFFNSLPQTNWPTLAVGIVGVVLLISLQQIGKFWGKRYMLIWIISILRNAIVLVLFTTVSYLLNKDRKTPLSPVTMDGTVGITSPKLPNMNLVVKLAKRSGAVFFAASIEHLAVGKAFGRRNGYAIDLAQELTALGTTNFIGSLLGGMPVSGAISRTVVNSESGVKSPLSGLVTTGMILLSIFKLGSIIDWIPKAIISAIIITAVWQVVVPLSVFYKYWRTSLVDFISSQLAFWITLFVSADAGIQTAVLFGFIFVVIRLVFVSTSLITNKNKTIHYPSNAGDNPFTPLPSDTKLFKFPQSIIFLNAERIRNSVMSSIQTYSIGTTLPEFQCERIWTDACARKIAEKRAKAGLCELDLQQTHVVIFDVTNVAYIDTTGLQALADLKGELVQYCGPSLQLRFVGMHRALRKKFNQIGWRLMDAGVGNGGELEGDMVYDEVGAAIGDVRRFDEKGEISDSVKTMMTAAA